MRERKIGTIEVASYDWSTNEKSLSEHFAIQCADIDYWELLDIDDEPRHTKRFFHKKDVKIIKVFTSDDYPEYFL